MAGRCVSVMALGKAIILGRTKKWLQGIARRDNDTCSIFCCLWRKFMELNVVKNAKRNMFFGIINRLVILLCPFVTRTVIQYVLGEQYLGLSSLFSSILSVLSLTELGFGRAIIYGMYKPVAEGNTELVNALLNFYRKVYALIGCVILMIGLVLIPFLPHLIRGEYPSDISLTVLYLVYLGNTVISYFMYAYMSSLIVVYQRDDINSRLNMYVTLLLAVSQIFMLVRFHNYMLFALMMPVFTVVNNIRIALVVKKMFPQYRCEGKVPRGMLQDMKKQIAGTFVSNVCNVTRNSFDSICTSVFLGLALTAMYNNYYYIMLAVPGFAAIFSTSLMGGIGNHVATRSREENFREMKDLDFVYMWISGWCIICTLCLSQPFMRLWMGESMMLPDSVVVLLCIYFYLLKVGDMRSIYSSVNGLWWHYRWVSIVEALANIVLNIVLAKLLGIHGIILATILTIFFIQILWATQITFVHYFGAEYICSYFRYHAVYAVVTAVLAVMTWSVCSRLSECSEIGNLLLRAVVCVVLPNAFYVLVYHNLPGFKKIRSIILRK